MTDLDPFALDTSGPNFLEGLAARLQAVERHLSNLERQRLEAYIGPSAHVPMGAETAGGPAQAGTTDPGQIASLAAGVVDAGTIAAGAIDAPDLFVDVLHPPKVVDTLPPLPDANFPVGSTVVLTSNGKLYRNVGSAASLSMGGRVVIDNSATSPAYRMYPGLTLMPNGSLLVCYAIGTGDGTAGKLYIRTSADSGATWSAATLRYDPGSSAQFGESNLMTTSAGRIILNCVATATVGTVYYLRVEYSDDNGATWGGPIVVTPAFTDPVYSSSGPCIELPNGDLLMPIYGKNTGETYYTAAYLRSTDNGLTWGSQTTIANGQAAGRHYAEPNIAKMTNGDLVCLLRCDTDSPAHIYRTVSSDNGATWSTPVVAFEGSGRPAVVEYSANCLVSVYRPNGGPGKNDWRISTDGGKTWSTPSNGAWTDPGHLEGLGTTSRYAAMVLRGTGQVQVAYAQEISGTQSDLYYRIFAPVAGSSQTWQAFIDGNDLSAASVSNSSLVAHTITSSEIKAGTITANEMAANTITAGQIAAGAIGTDQLAAKAVTAAKLQVGDFSNLVDNPGFETGDFTGWTATAASGATVSVGTPGRSGSYRASLVNGVANPSYITSNNYIAADAGEVFAITLWAAAGSGSGTNLRIQINCYDSSKSLLSSVYSDLTPTTAWASYSAALTTVASTAYVTLRILNIVNSTTLLVDDVSIGRGGTDIGPGGITVYNGAITVASDTGSTVIIDGTSQMFKIAYSGTLSKAVAAGATGSATATVGSGYATPPAWIGNCYSSLSGYRYATLIPFLVNDGAGYYKVKGQQALLVSLSAGSVVITLSVDLTMYPSGLTGYGRYYILLEAGI